MSVIVRDVELLGDAARYRLSINDGKIETITTEADARPATSQSGELDCVIDGGGLIACAGFVDVQINGGYGIDLFDEPERLWELGRKLPERGVTAYLPTIVSARPETRQRALDAIATRPSDYCGAEPVGLHFEGPMLSEARRGAHDAALLVEPSLEVISGWSRASGVALVTIAPELPGATEVIAELVRRGVTVALGHSSATAREAQAGFAAGATGVTHLFNAMEPLNHRAPGLAGVALANSTVICGLVADGVHVDAIMVQAVWNAKRGIAEDPDRRTAGLMLVSDAVAPMGLGPGRHSFAGDPVDVDEVSVRNADGVLAGSVLSIDQAVRNLVAFTGCSASEAVRCATEVPCDLIGEQTRGRLAPGRVGDVVLLDDDLNVRVTMCAGQVAHCAEPARIDKLGA